MGNILEARKQVGAIIGMGAGLSICV